MIRVRYYDPKRRTFFEELFDESWRAEAFMQKIRREGKTVREFEIIKEGNKDELSGSIRPSERDE